jgi:hypothetical protein
MPHWCDRHKKHTIDEGCDRRQDHVGDDATQN